MRPPARRNDNLTILPYPDAKEGSKSSNLRIAAEVAEHLGQRASRDAAP